MGNESISALQSAAQQVYDDMKTYFANPGGNMWTYGNAFDSMADFLMLTDQSAGSFLDEVYNSFQLPGFWYDDFCWPAIASLKAFDSAYSNVFKGTSTTYEGSYAKLFQDYTLANWKIVHAGEAPSTAHAVGTQNVWGQIDQKKWAAYAPRFQGGSWQCDINSDQNGQGLEPQNPGSNTLGPFQDSVMNGLLLVFATRLGRLGDKASKNPELKKSVAQAQKAQTAELAFLLNWYGNGSSSDIPGWEEALLSFTTETAYKNHDYSQGVLVRERIGTYAEQHGVYPALNAFDKDRFWAGDQGLQLGGLIDQTSSNTAIEVAVGIIKGVEDRMKVTDSSGNPWIQSCTPWSTRMFPGCYDAGGGGIFMRNLLHAMRTGNPTVLNYVKSKGYVGYISDLAHTAISGPQPQGGQNPHFVNLTRLAVLNVAIYFEKIFNIELTPTS